MEIEERSHNSESEENEMDGYSGSSEEESSDDGDYMGAFEDDDDEEPEKELGLVRMTSKQIGREYSYQILDTIRLFSMFQTKIVNVRDRFDYLQLSETVILENLRKHNFLVDDCCNALNDRVMKLMEESGRRKASTVGEEEIMCEIDFMPVEKHHAKDLGCSHMICTECWKDYIHQKVVEGMDCINAKCPMHGCNEIVTIELVNELADKDVADK